MVNVKRRKIHLIAVSHSEPSLDAKTEEEGSEKYRVLLTEHDGKRYVGEIESLALNAVLQKGGMQTKLSEGGRCSINGLVGELRTGDDE